MQDIMFFSKGKARSLRPDKKRMKELGKDVFMSGAKGMLPACFDIGPVKTGFLLKILFGISKTIIFGKCPIPTMI